MSSTLPVVRNPESSISMKLLFVCSERSISTQIQVLELFVKFMTPPSYFFPNLFIVISMSNQTQILFWQNQGAPATSVPSLHFSWVQTQDAFPKNQWSSGRVFHSCRGSLGCVLVMERGNYHYYGGWRTFPSQLFPQSAWKANYFLLMPLLSPMYTVLWSVLGIPRTSG